MSVVKQDNDYYIWTFQHTTFIKYLLYMVKNPKPPNPSKSSQKKQSLGVAPSPSPVLPDHFSCAVLKATKHSAALEELKAAFYFMEVILGPQQSS